MARLLVMPLLFMALYGVAHLAGSDGLVQIVKPIPVALLALGLATIEGRAVRWWIVLGLALSAVADAVIDASFLAGLGLFLGAHVAYLVGFTADRASLKLGRALPFALIVGLAASQFVPAAGDLGPAVAAYTVVIGLMGWRAAARTGSNPGAWTALVGVCLFLASDTLLAIDRFLVPLEWRTGLVMSTYWSAQLLIALGMAITSRAGAAPGR